MKIKLNILALCVSLLVAVPCFTQQALGQRVETVNRAPLPEVENLSGMREDDAAQATGIPRADLVIKDMCYASPGDSLSYVGILIANTGSVDAGPFELGIRYITASGTTRLGLDKVNGLKAGEEIWTTEAHACCGWNAQSLVYSAESFVAIADPRYYRKSMFPGMPAGSGEVKPVVPESNEGNNKMSAKKSEMRACDSVDKKVDRPTPMKVQPVRPRKP